MNITFVNHASVIINHNDISLITDPWIEGTAFNNGWSLIEPSKFSYNDFKTITHIWFSHEHPDHFSPPNLKNIPVDIRKNITILYQQTKDKKVINFCKKLGFKQCIELPPRWVELSNDFKILNIPHTDGDSWLSIKAGGYTLLNINDCVLTDNNQIKKIKKQVDAEKIDVLFTQFSYANWAGNKEDKEMRKKVAANKIQSINKQIAVFKPVYTIPFASFVWFGHEENFYLNDEINKIDYVYRYLKETADTIPVVLFPGDNWDLAQKHNSELSVQKWVNSYNTNIVAEKAIKPVYVTPDQLVKSGNDFIKTLKKNNSFLISFFLKPANIYMYDYNCSYTLSLKGFQKSSMPMSNCDIYIGSESLHYCFKHLWGGASTRINGRYQIPKQGNFNNWKLYFLISEINNHGQKFNVNYLFYGIYRKLRQKIYK
jgi:hypothetical protein